VFSKSPKNNKCIGNALVFIAQKLGVKLNWEPPPTHDQQYEEGVQL